ncbi:hypothetical protein [Pseudonocardia sp. 73-21]|uniref:hypothetical protein n=1 Tax=Pseudonocardia sp. 73-21 TaxID=1895809 RepID=UPI00260F5BE3|nr:hypothetical protein [Pseudonocardia sp. 73-21]
MCRCGHPEDAHEHYRPGCDCSRCDCTGYRAVPPWSPRAWLHLHRENVRLRQVVDEFAAVERALRLQLRVARAERDAHTGPIPRIPGQRRRSGG